MYMYVYYMYMYMYMYVRILLCVHMSSCLINILKVLRNLWELVCRKYMYMYMNILMYIHVHEYTRVPQVSGTGTAGRRRTVQV